MFHALESELNWFAPWATTLLWHEFTTTKNGIIDGRPLLTGNHALLYDNIGQVINW